MLVRGSSRCAEHARSLDSSYDMSRPSPTARGYDGAWRKVRAQFLARHPMCMTPGCTRVASEVHHIQPVALAPALRLHWSNLRGLCHPCHMHVTQSPTPPTHIM